MSPKARGWIAGLAVFPVHVENGAVVGAVPSRKGPSALHTVVVGPVGLGVG